MTKIQFTNFQAVKQYDTVLTRLIKKCGNMRNATVLSYLLDISKRENNYTIAVQQTEIYRHLNIHIMTVRKALKELRKRGFLTYKVGLALYEDETMRQNVVSTIITLKKDKIFG